MALTLFDTLSRQKKEFQPLRNNTVGLYTCGPTVYNFVHLGNLRAYVFADILRRSLLYNDYHVTQIMNVTDVGHLTGDRDMGEDKMEKAAATAGKTAWELASYYTEAFLNDLREMNILYPDKLVKATDHISDMIKLIAALEKKGYTYKTSDGIYFDTAKLSDYGKLAKLDLEGLKAGARVEINPEKKNPTDFALWKFSPQNQKRQMEWQSPWGIGFPGWHIECSAMSTKYLGQPFDIHTGGIDHIPVHHTNEIAQSEAAYDQPLARFWMHNEFVMVNEGRIGKSEGNQLYLQELKDKGYSPLAYRYFVLGGHYRSKLNFTWEALEGAQNSLHNLYSKIAEYREGKIGCAVYENRFFEKINDDLDTPEALAVMWELVHDPDFPGEAKLKSLFEFDKILGLSLRQTWEQLRRPLPDEIETLVREREAARNKKDFKASDDLRKQIEAAGFEVKDTDSGPLVKRQVR